MGFDNVTCGAGNRGDDGGFGFQQGIEQARFAGIGLAEDDDAIAFADLAASVGIGDGQGQGLFDGADAGENGICQFRRQVFVGEVDIDFDARQDIDQVGTPGFVVLFQASAELGQGLLALGIGFGVDQVGDGFGLGQVELAVFEGAAGKFTGFGKAQAEVGQDDVEAIEDRFEPWTCSSTQSSPVKLCGALNQRTTASSISSVL